MKTIKRILFYTALSLCILALLCACGKDIPEDIPEETPDVTEASVSESETTPTAETAPIYEPDTRYLCVRETHTNYENNSVFVTELTYDEYGQVIERWSVESDGTKTLSAQFTYDKQGNIIHETSKYGHYERTYDEYGNMLSERYFNVDGECKSESYFTYDAGYLVNEVRITRHSDETKYEYQITYNDDHTEARIECLKNGEYNGYTRELYNEVGQVTLTKNFGADDHWTNSREYEYDQYRRLVSESVNASHEAQADYKVIYTYDENGLLLSKNVDYYYGYLLEYTYEPFDVLVPVN